MTTFSTFTIHVRSALVFAGLGLALAVPQAHAQSAGAPQLTQLSNSRLTTNGTIATTEARGVQGANGRGGGSLGWGSFRLGGSGSRSTATLESGVSAGAVDIQGARLRNVDITASGTVSNSLANGGSLNAGGVSIR